MHINFWVKSPFQNCPQTSFPSAVSSLHQQHTRVCFFYMKHNSRNLERRTIAQRTWTPSLAILWLCVFPAFVLSVTREAEAFRCRRLPARDHPGFCWDPQHAFSLMWLNRPKVGLTICDTKTSSDQNAFTPSIPRCPPTALVFYLGSLECGCDRFFYGFNPNHQSLFWREKFRQKCFPHYCRLQYSFWALNAPKTRTLGPY